MAELLRSQASGLWWLVLLRGILLVLLGVGALLQPVLAVVAFTLVFGLYAIIDGVAVLIGAIAARKAYEGWGWLVAQGVLTAIAGVLIVALPGVAGLVGIFAVLWFLAISAVAGGVMAIVAASRVRGESRTWGIVGGVLDIVFGLLIALIALTSPAGAALATVWVAAIGAILIGVVLIVMAIRSRSGGQVSRGAPQPVV